MLRLVHSVPGLVLGLFLMVLGISGAILSFEPILERATAVSSGGQSVAELAATVQRSFQGAEQIDRRANGAIVVTWANGDAVGSERINPVSGLVIAQDAPSPVMRWVKDLHRSFLLDDIGRATAGIASGGVVVLILTGAFLLTVVQGGWRRSYAPVRSGTGPGWLHLVIGRVVIAVLALSAVTGAWMSLVSFELIPEAGEPAPAFPFEVAGTPPAPVQTLMALQMVSVDDLRSLTFPQPDNDQDVFGLQTATGSGYVDQATGEVLNWAAMSPARQVWEWVYALHTGQGLWWVGVLVGLGGAAMPVMAISGTMIWARRRAARPRIRNSAAASAADVVILVGSEGGSTWGFAATLQTALIAQGKKVHVAAMNTVRPYPKARHLFVLTATYGDGDAPGSAKDFLSRLSDLTPSALQVNVLAFGDRMYPQFCGFAEKVQTALAQKGWTEFHTLTHIDRQSTVDFAAWGRAVGQALGLPLTLDHKPILPPMQTLRLISREEYGHEVQAPVAVLRFEGTATRRFWLFGQRLARFQAGDLVGILPPGSDLPRFYSLASSRADGWLEICVRKAPGGLCSGFLHDLKPGDTVQAAIRPNPAFRPQSGKSPLVMIAAGCGIGPMAGFLRRLRPGRAVDLYFGARDPASDFLYHTELTGWKKTGQLSRLVTAFSRVANPAYVQQRLRQDAAHVREQIRQGGQILVCGSAAMAREVAQEIDHAIAPLGLTVGALKSQGRYLEDVY